MPFPQILKTCIFLSKLFSTLIKARICAEKCCKRLQKEMLPDYSCETFFCIQRSTCSAFRKSSKFNGRIIPISHSILEYIHKQTFYTAEITLSALIDKHGVLMLVSFSLFLSSDRTNCYSWRQNSIPGCFVLKV